LFGAKLGGRSKISNGTRLLTDVDGRSAWARRYRDLIGAFQTDLGGEQVVLSEGQKALTRRTSTLCIELERMEVKFAHGGGATIAELETFQRASNSLRRLLESLGIHRGRIARDITPSLSQYLRTKEIDGEAAE
jgi:hypothetical protein